MNKQNTEQLKKEFEYYFTMAEGKKWTHIYGVDPMGNNGHFPTPDDVWNFFLPHLISSDEIKREVHLDASEGEPVFDVDIDGDGNLRYTPITKKEYEVLSRTIWDFVQELTRKHARLVATRPFSWAEANKVAERVAKTFLTQIKEGGE